MGESILTTYTEPDLQTDDYDKIKKNQFIQFGLKTRAYLLQLDYLYRLTLFFIFSLTATIFALTLLYNCPALFYVTNIVNCFTLIIYGGELKYSANETIRLVMLTILAELLVATALLTLPLLAVGCTAAATIAGLAYIDYRFFALKKPKVAPEQLQAIFEHKEEKERPEEVVANNSHIQMTNKCS